MNPAATSPAPPLRRTAGDRVLLGVCGGLAHTLGARPLLVRAGALLLCALAFPLLLAAYAGIALIVPRDDGRVLLGGAPEDGREQLLGWAVVLSAGLLLLAAGLEPSQLVWPALSESGLVLAGLAIVALAVRDARGAAVAPVVPGAQPPATPPTPPAAPTSPAPAASAPAAPTSPTPGAPAVSALVPLSSPAVPAHRLTGEEPTVVDPQQQPTAVREPAAAAQPAPRRRTGLLVAGTIALVLAALATAGVVAGVAIGQVDGRAERAGSVAAEYGLDVGTSAADRLRSLVPGPGAVIAAGG